MKKIIIMLVLIATVIANVNITANAAESRVCPNYFGEVKCIKTYDTIDNGEYGVVYLYLPTRMADAWNVALNEYYHMPTSEALKADSKGYFVNKYNLEEIYSNYEYIFE